MYALEIFLRELQAHDAMFSIEDPALVEQIGRHDEIVVSYPVQYSSVPKFLSDFIRTHSELWAGKRVFVIATMALFSGDGAGVLGRLFRKYGATITGGLHLKMPDSIGDERVLKRTLKRNRQLVERAAKKAARAAACVKSGRYPQEGQGVLPRLAGFLTQRLWFGHRTWTYSSRLKIDGDKCVGCAKCAGICPTGNIVMEGHKAKGRNMCTVCYRCVNLCPKQAITLLGKSVIAQTSIEKYL